MDNESEPTVSCENCGRDIPESKSFLHESYCRRNVIRCPKCNEPVDKNEMTEHDNENHKNGSCKYCRKDMEKRLLEAHQESCPQKPKMCPYCNCEVSTQEYSQHTYTCGSRTKKCEFCKKNILVRDFDDHEPVCQIKQENYGENFPAMQEEKKETSNPYSGMSSKYMPNSNPTSNPYESLNQPTKSKNRDQGTSKAEVQPSSHQRKSNPTEDTKPPSRSNTRNDDILTRMTSQKQDTGYSRPREDKPSVPTGYPSSSKYSAEPKTTNVSEPYKGSYSREDPNAGKSVPTGYPSSSKYSADPKTTNVSDPYKAGYSRDDPSGGSYKSYSNPTDKISAGGYNRPGQVPTYNAATSDIGRAGNPSNPVSQTTGKSYLDNLVTRGQAEKPGISNDPRIGASGRPKVGETRPEYSHNAPENKPVEYKARYDPFGKGPTNVSANANVNKYSKPEDLKTNATSQNRVGGSRADPSKQSSGVSYPDKYKADARGEDKKHFLSDFTSSESSNAYGGSRSNQPQYSGYGASQASSNLNKKPEPSRYEGTSKVASKLTDFGNRPAQESRTQDPRVAEKKDYTTGKYGTSQSRTDNKTSDPTRSKDKSSSNSSQSRRNQPSANYNPQDYMGGYEDDLGLGQDAELQKAIQESLGGQKRAPSNPSQANRNYGDEHMLNQSMDDPEIQKAIQESLKGHY